MATVGIHFIWTSYGTWLPGDDRGHWSPLFDFYGRLIERGGKLNRGDLATQAAARELMKEPPKILSADDQAAVAKTIGTLVIDPVIVYAAAIEPTHVHVLLGPLAENIGRFAGRIKGMTSSAVLDLPESRGRTRTWTAKYWKVFLFDDVALAAVKRYIEEHNLRRGLAAAPFDWIYGRR